MPPGLVVFLLPDPDDNLGMAERVKQALELYDRAMDTLGKGVPAVEKVRRGATHHTNIDLPFVPRLNFPKLLSSRYRPIRSEGQAR